MEWYKTCATLEKKEKADIELVECRTGQLSETLVSLSWSHLKLIGMEMRM